MRLKRYKDEDEWNLQCKNIELIETDDTQTFFVWTILKAKGMRMINHND